MSNFLAVATVTATLRRMLHGSVGRDVDGAVVTSVRPDSSNGTLPALGVNVYLFQVTPNPELRNRDLPARRGDGTVIQRPEAALDLHYLISFHGDEARLEPHRLLGSITRTLHAHPIFSRAMIEDTVADSAFDYLAASDLAEQPERIRFVPMGLSLDELSQLWTGVFHQTQYYLSVAYRASVVLLTAEEPPAPALPVRRYQFLAQPSRQPVIEWAGAVRGPAVVGAAVRIVGQRLAGAITRVRLAGQELEPEAVGDREIRLTLAPPQVDTSRLRAGLQAVQVLHPVRADDSRGGMESNVAPLVLHPDVTGVRPDPRGVEVTVKPPVGERQRVNLLLNSVPGTATPSAFSLAATPRSSASERLTIPVPGVAAGTYLVRLQVDGSESLLEGDSDPASPTFERYTGPTVRLGTA